MESPNIKSNSSHLLQYLPLWAILIIPFILIMVAVVGLTSTLSFQTSQQVSDDLAKQLIGEINASIEHRLEDFLSVPAQINQSNANTIRLGLLDISDADAIGHYFWEEVQIYGTVTSIYFGNPEGGLVSGGREGADGSLYIITTDNFQMGALSKYATDSSGNQSELIVQVPEFDARIRPWYEGAAAREGANWTAPYVLSTGQDLAIASSLPVYDDEGILLGVVSVDVFVSHLSDFLGELNIGHSGEAYIVEHSGLLVATSTNAALATNIEDSTWMRLSAEESSDPLIAISAATIAEDFGGFSNLETQERLSLQIEGKNHYIWVTPFHSHTESGLDWLIVIVIPEDDFLGQLKEQNRVTIILTISAVLVAILVGMLAVLQISRPVAGLSLAARELAQGDWSQSVPIGGVREIRRLGQAFNSMGSQLQETFNTLEQRVDERTTDLAASESRYRAIVQDQTEFVSRYHPDGTLIFVNDAFCAHISVSREDLIGQSFFPYVLSKDLKILKERLATLSIDNQTVKIENRTTTADGQLLWTEWINHAFFDEQDKIVEIQGVGRDTTEQRHFKETLQKSLTRETDLGQLKSHFISTVSHEFRTPMTIIMNSADFLLLYADKLNKEKKDDHLLQIKKQIHRMDSLLEDVLTINRAERGKTKFSPETFDAKSLCIQVIKEVQVTSKNIAPIDFASEGKCAAVIADQELFTLIAANLIANAVKYTSPNDPISVKLACDEAQLTLKVEDKGFGIPEVDQPHIFEPFYRSNGVDNIAGTGLGLAIAKHSIEQHGGRISFTSEVGVGSIFTVTLPLTN